MEINYIRAWENYSEYLTEKGFKLWQWQYNYDSPEGFHAWFYSPVNLKEPDVEVVTHNKEVYEAIINYRSNRDQ